MKLLNWGIGILTVILIYLVMFVVPPAKGMGEAVRIVFFHVPMAWLAVVAFTRIVSGLPERVASWPLRTSMRSPGSVAMSCWASRDAFTSSSENV